MKYTKGDLVLVQTSYNTKLRKKYAIVTAHCATNRIQVKFIQTGTIIDYAKNFITPVATETK